MNDQSSEGKGFICHNCGQHHAELPMSFWADAPDLYYSVAPEERDSRCQITSDLCIIDGEHYFIRGCLEIPVVDGESPFVWGVWCSLSKESFKRIIESWEVEGRENDSPCFGWLWTTLPLHPETLHLKTYVHTRSRGVRPMVELEPTDHPLAVEQRQGITMARVQEIASALLHSGE